ncbi:sigma factor-like helix-turn-helix DNA-binding protein [Teredinibacter waterburyi]|uniref:sigma factor-like helix-turn-helix DNA-binding protein n=1 Tax=Teredinibacter waterburyi TaxID=1500538 RepID=UPI00165F0E41|nr:sigma factor-like helix-turn-helix DNA-binding protein [Teredinibacter waterburyi]
MDNDKEIESKIKKLLESGRLKESTKKVLRSLTAREAKVIRERLGWDVSSNESLEEIANRYEITRKKIKQIEDKALKKLRNRDPNNDDPETS